MRVYLSPACRRVIEGINSIARNVSIRVIDGANTVRRRYVEVRL